MGFMFLGGLSLKILHFPLSGSILILSLGTLAIVYFMSVPGSEEMASELFYTKEDARQINPVSRLGFRLSCWGLSILLIGILFTIQFWPNAKFFLIVGMLSALAGFVSLYVGIRDSLPLVFTRISQRLAIFLIIGLVLISTPRIKLFSFFHSNNPELVEAVRASWENPDDKELRKKVDEIRGADKSGK